MSNVELRQKYLATRTPDWKLADLRMAEGRLLAARLVRGAIGFALVGAVGGVLGHVLVGPTISEPSRALPLMIALGSAISGGISFAVLASMGFVVLGEIVGEEKERPRGKGTGAVLGEFAEKMAEMGCGLVLGAICGLAIGLLAWLASGLFHLPHQGTLDSAGDGAIGGMILAVLFGLLVMMVGPTRLARRRAKAWGSLGPLPTTAYFVSRLSARRRYLRK